MILEGHSDVTMAEKQPSLDKKSHPRICFYAGGVSKQYGLGNLVDGFRMADIPNARLHIYGPGDYVEELQQIAVSDDRIFYGGMLLNTMEYMASGTPVLTTVLPGMPKEYHPYVYLLEDETAEGIARKLREVLETSDEGLFQKGQEARKFVLEQKNNVIQAQKILEMLKTM